MRMSICVTAGNGRNHFIPGFIENLGHQNYDLKDVELCVTYAPDATAMLDCLRPHVSKFAQIKVAMSDRSKLPFVIPENNPACDVNAQVCNVASAEKIVRTDFEVRLIHPGTLARIDKLLEVPELCVVLSSWHVNEHFVWPDDLPRVKEMSAPMGVYSFVCSSFRRSDFIKNGGVDERFALGFAGEDSYFHFWWRDNRKLAYGLIHHQVVHLWHGDWRSPNRLRLRDTYSVPLMKRLQLENATPNEGNPEWGRIEMISQVETWKN